MELDVEGFVTKILASPYATNAVLLTHPTREHHYIVAFLDDKNEVLTHRILDAAQMVRYANTLLSAVNQFSLEAWSSVIPLMGETEGSTQ